MRLLTNRCLIRPVERSDFHDIKELQTNIIVRQYLGGPVAIETFETNFEHLLNPTDGIYWSVRLKATHEFIGLVSIDSHHDGTYQELSYEFSPPYFGTGLAYEVTTELIRFAFEELKLTELVSETQDANMASCRLLKRLGMKQIDTYIRFDAKQNLFLIQR